MVGLGAVVVVGVQVGPGVRVGEGVDVGVMDVGVAVGTICSLVLSSSGIKSMSITSISMGADIVSPTPRKPLLS